MAQEITRHRRRAPRARLTARLIGGRISSVPMLIGSTCDQPSHAEAMLAQPRARADDSRDIPTLPQQIPSAFNPAVYPRQPVVYL